MHHSTATTSNARTYQVAEWELKDRTFALHKRCLEDASRKSRKLAKRCQAAELENSSVKSANSALREEVVQIRARCGALEQVRASVRVVCCSSHVHTLRHTNQPANRPTSHLLTCSWCCVSLCGAGPGWSSYGQERREAQFEARKSSLEVHRLRQVVQDMAYSRNRAAQVDGVSAAINGNPYRPTTSYRHQDDLPQEVRGCFQRLHKSVSRHCPRSLHTLAPVSYTHLTLPTIYSV